MLWPVPWKKFLVYGSGDVSKHACPKHFGFPPNLQPRESEIEDAVLQPEKPIRGELVESCKLRYFNSFEFFDHTGLVEVKHFPGEFLNAYPESHFRRHLASGSSLLVGRWIGGAAATVDATTIKYFLVLWLVATLVNMRVGVSKAGYSIKDEAPIALLVFAVPAIVAIVIWWRFSAS
jgi:hypothetical protein